MREKQITKNYFAGLQAEHYYHIYNRTNNKEILFRSDENRLLFLKKYKEYLKDYLHTYAYCLLDNHFHLLVSVRNASDIFNHIKNISKIDRTKSQQLLMEMPEDEITVHKVMEQQFTRLFTSYAMRFNKMWNRAGNLFYRPFKRLDVNNEVHFTKLIHYIHANPLKHKLTKDFTSYRWSSFQSFLTDKSTSLERDEVLEWFGGKRQFIEFHQIESDFAGMSDLLIED